MTRTKHFLHGVAVVLGVAVAAVVAVVSGGDAFALAIAGGASTGIGYWAGAIAQRRHGHHDSK